METHKIFKATSSDRPSIVKSFRIRYITSSPTAAKHRMDQHKANIDAIDKVADPFNLHWWKKRHPEPRTYRTEHWSCFLFQLSDGARLIWFRFGLVFRKSLLFLLTGLMESAKQRKAESQIFGSRTQRFRALSTDKSYSCCKDTESSADPGHKDAQTANTSLSFCILCHHRGERYLYI